VLTEPCRAAHRAQPFKFTGTINKVTIAVDPPKLTPADIQKLQGANRSASD
jgi:hypothetical protein